MIPAIDTHCHIYPDAIAARAVVGIGNFYNRPLMYDGRVCTLLAEGKRAGIVHFIVSSVATTPHQVKAINMFIAKTVQQHKDEMTGLGTLHPDSTDQAGDVRQLLELGLVGVKLHPDTQKVAVDDPRYLKIFELCEGVLPICCHMGDNRYDYSNPNRVIPVLRSFPDLCLIGAHFGGWSIWKEAAPKLCEYSNLMVDCSSALFALTPEEALHIIRLYGAQRVIFGTDYPMWSAVEERNRFDSLALTEKEQMEILYQNAAELYHITINND
ncbi:MAG: amidohydrolase family protein [Clostridia bacterium]